MPKNAFKVLAERGFIYQCTHEEALAELFDKEQVTAYVGFDATAASLHVGHLLPIMALSWLDRLGHRPVALMGGGTTMVGDPSGRTISRQILTKEIIRENLAGIRVQIARYLNLDQGRAIMADNSDWLLDLNYLDFLREIGQHFSVNRMLAAESYKARLETGLTFLEFNYMVMQAYDFLHLYQTIGNKVQMGGQDQWGNIVAGLDLIRRVEGGEAYGLTFPLLIDPKTGEKFGKTNDGAVWLDKEKTSAYNFYQFWRNIDDSETGRLLNLFTYLPLEETAYLGGLPPDKINRAKEILAFEATRLAHGPAEAQAAYVASVQAFGPADPEAAIETSSAVARIDPREAGSGLPSLTLNRAALAEAAYVDLFVLAELVDSKSEARRLIRQGGAYINERPVDSGLENSPVTGADWYRENQVILKAGKKRHKHLKLV